MPRYFRYFPETKYKDKILTNITRRVRFDETIATDPYVFLPYTIKNDERPEDVAFFYYGSVDYVWMIYLANNIIDPYYDWPMNQKDFDNHIIEKYADEANTTGRAVLEWSMNTNITENILYYQNDSDERISPETYNLGSTLDPDFSAAEWRAIRVWDYEFERNENRRNILVVDKKYARRMDKELQETMDV
jgi:hypothetical protein